MEHHSLCHSVTVRGANCSCVKMYRQDVGGRTLLEFAKELRALGASPTPEFVSESEQAQSARWLRHTADLAERKAGVMSRATIPIVMRSALKTKEDTKQCAPEQKKTFKQKFQKKA